MFEGLIQSVHTETEEESPNSDLPVPATLSILKLES